MALKTRSFPGWMERAHFLTKRANNLICIKDARNFSASDAADQTEEGTDRARRCSSLSRGISQSLLHTRWRRLSHVAPLIDKSADRP
jgi:hypothetical protein